MTSDGSEALLSTREEKISRSALCVALPLHAASAAESLNIYSARHYDSDELLYDGFQEATGIPVNVIEGDGPELLARMKAEGMTYEERIEQIDQVTWPKPLAEVLERRTRPLNTTIGVVVTDARLTQAECTKLAQVAHDGLARAANPSHLLVDGHSQGGLHGSTEIPLSHVVSKLR